MQVEDLPWVEAPEIQGRRAKFFGISIIETPYINHKYEAMTDEPVSFDSDEGLLAFLREELPGCFIGEM